MSEQRKNTGTRKRATKKDTENKTTRTRKKVAEEQAAPVQQNEEAAPDRVKAEEEQTARAPEQMRHKRSRWDIRKVDRLRRALFSSVKRLDCKRTRGQVHDRRTWRHMERVTEHRKAPALAVYGWRGGFLSFCGVYSFRKRNVISAP